MKRTFILSAVGSILALSALLWARSERPPGSADVSQLVPDISSAETERILQHSPLGSAPPDPTNGVADNPAAAELGQALFFDPRLSRDANVSCATCHIPSRSFTDGRALLEEFRMDRKVPSLWNVAFNRWYFWDGRSDSLWAQALKPLENPGEHGGNRLQFAHLVARESGLKRRYERVFGPLPDLSDGERFPRHGGPFADPSRAALQAAWLSMAPEDQVLINRIFANLGKAIAAYERRLISRHSRFDVFAEGLRDHDPEKLRALSSRERDGLKLFIGRGQCRLCHSGPNFTDGEFHNIGIQSGSRGIPPSRYSALQELKSDPFNSKGMFSDDPDCGRQKLDHLLVGQDLWGQVKTPSLRNVAKTSPYMHQGQFTTLTDVVRFYSHLGGMTQAGTSEHAILAPVMLRKEEEEALVAFLESLTDETLEERLTRPIQE